MSTSDELHRTRPRIEPTPLDAERRTPAAASPENGREENRASTGDASAQIRPSDEDPSRTLRASPEATFESLRRASATREGASEPGSGTAPDAEPAASGAHADADTEETSDEEAEAIGKAIIEALKSCYDPEIPVDIYELGLIYAVELEGRHAVIRMTLTSPMCPVAESLPLEVEQKVREVPGVSDASIDLVWDPPWDPSMMSEVARLELGY